MAITLFPALFALLLAADAASAPPAEKRWLDASLPVAERVAALLPKTPACEPHCALVAGAAGPTTQHASTPHNSAMGAGRSWHHDPLNKQSRDW